MTDSIVHETVTATKTRVSKLRKGDVVVTQGGELLTVVYAVPRSLGPEMTPAVNLGLENAQGETHARLLAANDIAPVVEFAPKPLKVSVTLTIEVDRDKWELAYGERDAKSIREGVKSMFHTDGVFAEDSGAEVVNAR